MITYKHPSTSGKHTCKSHHDRICPHTAQVYQYTAGTIRTAAEHGSCVYRDALTTAQQPAAQLKQEQARCSRQAHSHTAQDLQPNTLHSFPGGISTQAVPQKIHKLCRNNYTIQQLGRNQQNQYPDRNNTSTPCGVPATVQRCNHTHCPAWNSAYNPPTYSPFHQSRMAVTTVTDSTSPLTTTSTRPTHQLLRPTKMKPASRMPAVLLSSGTDRLLSASSSAAARPDEPSSSCSSRCSGKHAVHIGDSTRVENAWPPTGLSY